MNKAFILLLIFLTSCTATLWHQPENEAEYLNGFYVNKDIHVLLASTDKNGYIFPISDEFEQILLLSRTVLFQPHFGTFNINKNHEVSGNFTLSLSKEETHQNEIEQLQKLGFIQYELDENILYFSVFLKGKQYTIEGNLPLVNLDKKYKINVNRPAAFSSSTSKIIATPATIAFDAVVVLPASFMLATFWIMAEN
jgi:hypothetical protein